VEKRAEIERLFNLYLSDQCSPEQVQQLADYFQSGDNEELLKTLIGRELNSPANGLPQPTPQKLDQIFKDIRKKMKK